MIISTTFKKELTTPALYSSKQSHSIQTENLYVRVDISYVDPETDDDAANDAIIVENIKNARNRLKDGMAVSFLEHNSEIGKALREASYDMPVLSMLMDQDVYDGIDVSTLANLGFSNVIAGTIAGEEFKSQGVKVTSIQLLSCVLFSILQSALCLLNDRRVYGHLDICKTFFKVAEVEDQDIKTVNAEVCDLFLQNRSISFAC